ncbi:MAG: outer spore coat protein CotE [Bacilli bacterium]|nr:outer spore coat protein CotE [Bacilli bacterium]
MANYKEIVTKAVIGKTKKSTSEDLIIDTKSSIDTVLGCWVINHNFSGRNNQGKVHIEGSYDVNIWYSFSNNTKTDVLVRNFVYKDIVNVKLKNDNILNNTDEIIVRSLSAPSVTKVDVDGSNVKLNIEKELGVEIVGEAMVKVAVEEDYDDYDNDDSEPETYIEEAINDEIDEDYLNGVNQ